jgi:hypothetical protein
MPTNAIKTYIGRVKGDDGFNPIVDVHENTSASYRLQITDKTHTFLTPNLRGATFKSAMVEVMGREPIIIPFTDLGLNPDHDYLFYAAAGIDYPCLRSINAVRVENDAIQVSVYWDTVPYTQPRQGSPFGGGFLKIGTPGLVIGGFNIGEQHDDVPFPVNLLCFEIEETEEVGNIE